MRRPSVVATSALAVLGTCALLGIGERDGRAEEPRSSPSNGGRVSRYAIAGMGTLLVSRTEDEPSIAVCVAEAETTAQDAGPARLTRSAPDPLELARRGGSEQTWVGPEVSTWCASLPRNELSYALWLSAHLRVATPGPGLSATRGMSTAAGTLDEAHEVRALALEGTVPLQPAELRVVCLTGGLPPDGVTELAARHLGALAGEPAIRPSRWSLLQTSERLSVLEGESEVPVVRYGWATPDDGANVAAALDVAFEILAGRDEARLPRLLVPRALARHVSAWSERSLGGAVRGLTVQTTTRTSVDRVRRFVDGSLKQLRLVGPSAREVSQASARLRRRALETWEDVLSRARALAELELLAGDARRLQDDVESLSRVTPERVRSAAHDHLVDSRRTTLELYPKLWPADDPALSGHHLYTVAEGDTLAGVAARFHVDAARLAKDNDVDPRYSLVPGQPLWIAP